MNYIKESPFAKKTVLLAFITFSIWLSFLLMGTFKITSMALSIAVCSLCSYILFTPMHEASHGNIAGRIQKYKKLEKYLGYLSGFALFIPFPMFRVLHLRHHSFTNDEEKDPDFWVATNIPIFLFMKCFTIKPHYYYHAFFKATEPMKNLYVNTFSCVGIYLVISGVMAYLGHGTFFLIWIVSSMIALAFLAFLFDWLPHYPHKQKGRYKDTTIITFRWLDEIMLLQNYHLIHHLYPRVPFYNYKKAFKQIEQDLIDKEAMIVR